MLSGATTMPLSQTMMIIVLGWSWGLAMLHLQNNKQINTPNGAQSGKQSNKAEPNKIMHILFLLLLIYTTILIVKGVFPRVFYLPYANSISIFESGSPTLSPRFWAQGALELFYLVKYH